MELSTPATAVASASAASRICAGRPAADCGRGRAERGQALSTFWRDVRAGRVPPAYYVSPRCPRWRRSELRAALEACRAPAKAAG